MQFRIVQQTANGCTSRAWRSHRWWYIHTHIHTYIHTYIHTQIHACIPAEGSECVAVVATMPCCEAAIAVGDGLTVEVAIALSLSLSLSLYGTLTLTNEWVSVSEYPYNGGTQTQYARMYICVCMYVCMYVYSKTLVFPRRLGIESSRH